MITLAIIFTVSCTSYILEDPYKAYKYNRITGELIALYPKDVKVVYDASLKALDELKIKKLAATSDNLEGRIEGITALGKKVVLILKTSGSNLTTVYIRVGDFGNLEYSAEIKKKIDEVIGITQ